LNPHGPFKPCGFSYRLRLSPPGRDALESSRQVCGLDYPFTFLRKIRSLGAARLVSTPSRWCLSGLGSGLPFKVSPNLSSSASPVSQTSTQVFLKSAAYAVPPRPRAAVLLMIGHVVRFYTSVFSSPVGVFVGVSTLSSSTLFLFFRMTLIAAASSDVLISFIAVRRPEGGRKSSGEPSDMSPAMPAPRE
jgi:hypothetical protein